MPNRHHQEPSAQHHEQTAPQDELDELEPEVVEDLEVDDDAEEQVRGGTSLDCRRH